MAKKKNKLKAKAGKSPAKKSPAATNRKVEKRGDKVAKKSAATKSAAPKSALPAKSATKTSWLDDEGHRPAIEKHARRLAPFVEALADGKVDEGEVKAQERRLVKLMKEIEPELSPAMHAKVTQLLCELTAYDLMQILHTMEQARPKTTFRG